MQVKERTRQEIEARLKAMGDYVRIDYLQSALSTHLDFDTKRYVLLTLSGIYENKNMFLEAGRLMKNAAEINTTFKAKMQDYMKSVLLMIKAGTYQDADMLFAQALALGNEREKTELKQTFKNHYLGEGRAFLKKDKRTQAKKVFEKIITLDLSSVERKEAQDTLLDLYQKLGNIREFYKLRDSIK